jgi:hypothetical protein
VKLPLFIIKHHTVKTYWDRGYVAPCIFNLGTKWR